LLTNISTDRYDDLRFHASLTAPPLTPLREYNMSLHRIAAVPTLLIALFVLCVPGHTAFAQEEPAPEQAEPAEQDLALQEADPAAFRRYTALQMLCQLYNIRPEPLADDDFLDLLPQGTERYDLVNPGFEFTHAGGQKPGRDFWIIGIERDQPGNIRGGMQGPSDPIRGWSATGCSGLESGRPRQWVTAPDGCTGYIVAQGRNNTLYQTVDGVLNPNTRYTLLVECYARNDYRRAEAEEILFFVTDAQGSALNTVATQTFINPADANTRFSVSAISFTTSAEQPAGDLMIHIGMNAEGGVRFNFDNVRLWVQPIQ